jgi:hypothetical protein
LSIFSFAAQIPFQRIARHVDVAGLPEQFGNLG